MIRVGIVFNIRSAGGIFKGCYKALKGPTRGSYSGFAILGGISLPVSPHLRLYQYFYGHICLFNYLRLYLKFV